MRPRGLSLPPGQPAFKIVDGMLTRRSKYDKKRRMEVKKVREAGACVHCQKNKGAVSLKGEKKKGGGVRNQ